MAKRSRNKQAVRERIARMRAEQARRRRRWIRLVSGAAAATVISVAAAIVLAVTGGSGAAGGATSGLSLAPLSTLGALRPAPAPGVTGPEGVPVPAAAPLAGTATAATGQPVDQISCQTGEQTLFHIHAHLAIFVNGKAWQIPAAIGIPGAQAQQTPNGPYIATGSCFYWLHTHAADGIIHIESPVHRSYTLGNFFDEWGQPLSTSRVGPASGHVVANAMRTRVAVSVMRAASFKSRRWRVANSALTSG